MPSSASHGETRFRAPTDLERDWRFDVARVFACVGVIILHATGASARACASGSFATTFHFAFRASVGIFFATSGYFQLSHERASRGPRAFFIRRARRVWTPTLFWSVFYVVLYAADLHFRGEEFDAAATARAWAWSGKPGAGYHLWFLYALIAIDLMTPALSWARRRLSSLALGSASVALWLVYAAPTMASTRSGGSDASALWIGAQALGYLTYFYWGKALGDAVLSSGSRKFVFAAALLGAVVSLVGMTTLARVVGYDFARNPFEPFWALQTASLFSLALTLPREAPERLRVVFARLASATFGAYLIHVAILPVLTRALSTVADVEGFGVSAATCAGTIVASFAAAALMQKIPFVRALV